jgi:hypothetical protein
MHMKRHSIASKGKLANDCHVTALYSAAGGCRSGGGDDRMGSAHAGFGNEGEAEMEEANVSGKGIAGRVAEEVRREDGQKKFLEGEVAEAGVVANFFSNVVYK